MIEALKYGMLWWFMMTLSIAFFLWCASKVLEWTVAGVLFGIFGGLSAFLPVVMLASIAGKSLIGEVREG